MKQRKITFKEISKEMNEISAPSIVDKQSRISVGIDNNIGEYHFIALEKLEQYEYQSRKLFSEETLKELYESIKVHGVRQPLTVKLKENGNYAIISGERRYRAARMAELLKVPCIILKNNETPETIALVENLHRENLHPLELLGGYKDLINKGLCSGATDISRILGIDRTKISEILSYDKISEQCKDMLIEQGVSERKILRRLRKLSHDVQLGELTKILERAPQINEVQTILKIFKDSKGIRLQRSNILITEKDRKEIIDILEIIKKEIG